MEIWLRRALFATAALNILGVLTFWPGIALGPHFFGLPQNAHPLYLAIIAAWILIFGAAYLYQALAPRIDRLFLAVGAAGKASFVLIMLVFWLRGDIPALTALSSLPDLLFAALFVAYLARTRVALSPK